MPAPSTRANNGGGVKEAVHVVTVNVVGLTGISVDTSQPASPAQLGKDGAAVAQAVPPLPKQMKAVVAVLRDQQTHSITSLSRGLVQSSAAMEQQHSHMPNHKKYIAVWDNNNNNNNNNKPPAASFEASIPIYSKDQQQHQSNHEPRTMQPHRNFELIVGLTVGASSKATPIGAASLPLAEAARLSGANGKVLLDLPVYNYASLTMDPFSKPMMLETAIPLLPQHNKNKQRRKLSFSRKKKNSSSDESTVATTASTAGMSKDDVGTLAVVNQLQKLNALGYNYFMDPSRDAAVLRVELEVHQKESNVEMDWRASSSFEGSNKSKSNKSKQPRVVLLDTQEQAIETAHSAEGSTTPTTSSARNGKEDSSSLSLREVAHAMEPSIERVLSSEDDDKQQQQQRKEKKPPPTTPTRQPGSPKSNKRAKSSKQFRVRIVDQTLQDYEVNPSSPVSDAVPLRTANAKPLQAATPSNSGNTMNNGDSKLFVLENAIERILSDQDEKSAKSSQEASLHNNHNMNSTNNEANDEIEVKRLSSTIPPEPVKVPTTTLVSTPARRRMSGSSASRQSAQRSVTAGSIISGPSTPERAAANMDASSPSSPPKVLRPSSTKSSISNPTTPEEKSVYDVDSGRQHYSTSNSSSVVRSKVSVVSTAPTTPVKNSPKASRSSSKASKSEAAVPKSSSKASKSDASAAAGSKSVKSKSDSSKFLQRNKLKPPPGSGGKSLRKIRGKQKPTAAATTATATTTTATGSVAATDSTAPESVYSRPNKTFANSSNDTHQKTTITKGSTKPVVAVAPPPPPALVAPEPLVKEAEIRAQDVPSPVDRMKMNFERRFSGQSSKRADAATMAAEATTGAQAQIQTKLPKQPASVETPQQQQKANSAGAKFSNPLPQFTRGGDLQFKQNFDQEEITSIWTEDPSFVSRNKKGQPPKKPNRAAAVAQRLFGAMNLEPCSAAFMDKEYDEDGTVGSLTMITDEGTFATARTRRETIVDDLADLGLLVGRMCQQRGLGRVVDFDDDETMTTAYGGRGDFPREPNSIDGTDEADTFEQPKPRWLKGLNTEALRSFGESRGFRWTRATEEPFEDEEDVSHYTEGSMASASFVDEMDASLEDDHDGTITTAEGTEVDIMAVAQASQPVKSIINSTASTRSIKSKRSNKTPPQQNRTPPQQQQQQQQQKQQPFEEVLISGSSESNSTTELVFTALGPVPAKDAASRISADKTKKTTATDDESPKNVMHTPSVDGNIKSFTQSLVDMVANAITPVPNSHDGADTFNVPSVLEADFENGSVGELTATTLEMQVEMAEFRKQLEKLQKDAREANGGPIQLSEITAAAEAAMAKQQAKGGGHAV